MTGWVRRRVTARANRAYAKLTLNPDSAPAFARYVGWLLVAVLAGADVGDDY